MMRTPEKSNSVPDITALDQPGQALSRKRRKPADLFALPQQEMTSDFKNEIKELFKQFAQTQSEQVNTILTSLNDLKQTSSNIENTVTFLCEENLELKRKIEQMQMESKKDKEEIVILENKLEDMQKSQRKTSIEIKNVPLKGEETKKDLLEMIVKLSENINLKLVKPEVKDIIKIKKKENTKSTIIVEFTNTFIRTDILKCAKNYNIKNKTNKLSAKHLGLQYNPDVPIYISENLTPKSARLYFLARDLQNTKNYKYCWTNYGKVYIRLDDNSPIITITSESQVHQLLNK
ncbi:hypothetical protein JYU34_006789 [Plutella xylostella]|uniref:FP protein C-terminal domain-containing protein n=2 Tax=Plutella xylostella TaxID=51655 RepID=A0ABQ7QSV7_PLUXY|nr:hypothetical protein JYU34_006789 [Plutella xylostella]